MPGTMLVVVWCVRIRLTPDMFSMKGSIMDACVADNIRTITLV